MIVVDASVAALWFLGQPKSERARSLLRIDADLVAPELIIAEVADVAFKLGRAGHVPAGKAKAMAEGVGPVLTRIAPMAPLAGRAFDLSQALGHPAYDCFYVALGEAHDAPLATFDERLASRMRDAGYERLIYTV